MADRGSYRSIHTVIVDDPRYQDLAPASKLVLMSALATMPAPFPAGLDRDRLAAVAGLDRDVVERALARCVAAGLLVAVGDLFDVGHIAQRPLVIVPRRFHVGRRRTRRRISRRVREFVISRDGYRCRGCGCTSMLELDHVEPWSLGGSDEPENLQLLCGPCNRLKGPTAFITHRIGRGARS